MSTVAWDGKTLAADRQATSCDTKVLSSKICRLEDGTILAWTGIYGGGRLLKQWYEEGADLYKYPKFQEDKEDWVRLIAVKPNKTIPGAAVFIYERLPVAIPVMDAKFAWGSGRDFALGALEMGATAEEAILVASKFNISTGMGVESYSIE